VASAKPTIHEVDFCSQMATAVGVLVSQDPSGYSPFREKHVGSAMSIKWFRVLYRPHGEKGFWNYGWLFASDSLVRANETIDQVCRVKDRNRWTYRVEEIDPRDFDYPR